MLMPPRAQHEALMGVEHIGDYLRQHLAAPHARQPILAMGAAAFYVRIGGLANPLQITPLLLACLLGGS